MNSFEKYFIFAIAPVILITSFSCRQNKENDENHKDYAAEVVDDGLQHTFDICMIMNEYPHKGPTGQFHWQEDVYRGLAYYNTVKLRENNDYQVRFFPFFPFGGLKDEAKAEIWQTAMKNKP